MFAEYKRDVSHKVRPNTWEEKDPDRKYNVFYIKMPHAGTGWNMALLL